jgi:hypothetical protein
MTKTPIASLKFNSSLLTSESFYWLPLFLSPKNFLKSLPSEILPPKILFAVNKEYFKPYPEIFQSPSKDSSSDFFKFFNLSIQSSQNFEETEKKISNEEKLKSLQKKITKLQLELIQREKTFKEKLKDLKKRLNESLIEVETEKSYRKTLQEQMEKCYFLLNGEKSGNLEMSPNSVSEILVKQESVGIFHTLQDDENHLNFHDFHESRFEGILDKKVQETLKKFNFEGLLKKCRELNYKVGNKIVTLQLKRGEVFCKSGLSLEKYIFNNCRSEIESLLRQKTSPQKRSVFKTPCHLSRTPGVQSKHLLRFNIS